MLKRYCQILLIVGCSMFIEVQTVNAQKGELSFPAELTTFQPYAKNPIFTGRSSTTQATEENAWDQKIRERGWILKENGLYRMWYTGYRDEPEALRKLGYATSIDGVHWQRHPENPILPNLWIEDMMVMKQGDLYYMFAEGKADIAHYLTSKDGVDWQPQGPLDIRQTSGEPISKGPRGTPTVWYAEGTWYLFYERMDQGVWLATSKGLKVFTNYQDDPVLKCGPEPYDKYAVALNQILFYQGKYYAYYHGSGYADWREWNTNIAVSEDLIHWTKYAHNPILEENQSSGIVVEEDDSFRLYSMHDKVQLHFSVPKEAKDLKE
ncbi:Glycosyl hydrolase [Planctomycetales bacterium 10988]|nr:Glycosyl hydrolase [Planctomycetales bacterium 10988]